MERESRAFFRSNKQALKFRAHCQHQLAVGPSNTKTLPNGLVLTHCLNYINLWDPSKHQLITTRKSDSFGIRVITKIDILPDDQIAVYAHRDDQTIVVLNARTLATEPKQEMLPPRFNHIRLNHQQVAHITEHKDKDQKELASAIFTLDLKTQEYKQASELLKKNGSFKDLISLADGRYASQFYNYDNGQDKIYIFDYDEKSHLPFKLKHIIHLEEHLEKNLPGTPNYTKAFIGLPDGRILTHAPFEYGIDCQLWDGEKCVDQWNWNKILKPIPKRLIGDGYYYIHPFPDNIHLLLHFCDQHFIFNMQNHTARRVELGDDPSWLAPAIGLDGQVFYLFEKKKKATPENDKTFRFVQYDPKEMIEYRKTISESLNETIQHQDAIPIIKDYLNFKEPHEVKDEKKEETSCCRIM